MTDGVADEIILPVISHTIGLITTVLRLLHRKQRNRLWWDDVWALVALLFDTTMWIFYLKGHIGLGYRGMSRSKRLFIQLGILYSYTTALWLARISIAVTIVRLLNPGRFRMVAKTVAILFGLFWLVLVIQKMFRCGVRTLRLAWCPIPRTTGYLELSFDILGDSWLVLSPVYMLWIMKISRIHRWLVFGIFSCSALTIGASVAHIYFIIIQSLRWVGTTAQIQSGVSLTVCNLLVLVTYIYRVLFNVEQNAAIPIRHVETCERHPPGAQPPSVLTEVTERSQGSAATGSERGAVTAITLTDLGSEFGNTGYTTPSSAPSSGGGSASYQVESLVDGQSFKTSQLRSSPNDTFSSV